MGLGGELATRNVNMGDVMAGTRPRPQQAHRRLVYGPHVHAGANVAEILSSKIDIEIIKIDSGSTFFIHRTLLNATAASTP